MHSESLLERIFLRLYEFSIKHYLWCTSWNVSNYKDLGKARWWKCMSKGCNNEKEREVISTMATDISFHIHLICILKLSKIYYTPTNMPLKDYTFWHIPHLLNNKTRSTNMWRHARYSFTFQLSFLVQNTDRGL